MELSERQKEIIEVSLGLIAEKGIQGLTIKNLARKIGFSESAIYRHYENKIQILVAILNYFQKSTDLTLESDVTANIDAVSRINLMFQKHFEKFSGSPSLVAVIFSEELFRNEEILIRKVSEIMNSNFEALTKIILSGQKKGEIRTDIEASHIAVMLLGSLRLFVKQWHMSDYSFDLLQKGKELINSFQSLLKTTTNEHS